MTHKHQCGLTAVGMLESFGCGHVWEHRDGSSRLEHYCPQCGKGPFTFQLVVEVVHTEGAVS